MKANCLSPGDAVTAVLESVATLRDDPPRSDPVDIGEVKLGRIIHWLLIVIEVIAIA